MTIFFSYSKYEAQKVAAAHKKTIKEMFEDGKWIGGSESAMFNRLEDISVQMQPVTPFLKVFSHYFFLLTILTE